ncbi:unnamed protein product [Fraxinus pennsylvanica]|uniref:Remorin C-terminal domain-containing protein n=1 Tax=Fraxinus pennsylvanica TaxID=56036 RepID=A0AAD1YS96_9LAMI|nr:unnamed protein product [Fraxinus pennsylvanica]
MRSIEDKGCLSHGTTQEMPDESCMSFEFHKGNGMNRASHQRTALGKPTPSKWDDAQKWLVNLSKEGDKNQAKASPRNSNADDKRLIVQVPKKEYSSGEEDDDGTGSTKASPYEVETKKIDCDESIWRISKPVNSSASVVSSICVRDMGTEMTPIASQEPSRTATPIKARTPVSKSPICSGPSTPVRSQSGLLAHKSGQAVTILTGTRDEGSRGNGTTIRCSRDGEEPNANNAPASRTTDQSRKLNPLETRATAWDEAERAKNMARYKREEVKIQVWENHQKRKAEMGMRRMEVKAERMKSRAQEKYTNKLASTRRIAEEKRSNAEAKLNEKAVKTSERADYIRRTGHLPSSFFFKLPSFCSPASTRRGEHDGLLVTVGSTYCLRDLNAAASGSGAVACCGVAMSVGFCRAFGWWWVRWWICCEVVLYVCACVRQVGSGCGGEVTGPISAINCARNERARPQLYKALKSFRFMENYRITINAGGVELETEEANGLSVRKGVGLQTGDTKAVGDDVGIAMGICRIIILNLLQEMFICYMSISINVPFWYYAFNALLTPFLTQRTKIIFGCPARVTEKLLKYIGTKQILCLTIRDRKERHVIKLNGYALVDLLLKLTGLFINEHM